MTGWTCPRIQIAGVHDLDEAMELVRLGVDSIGFPLRLAVHPEDLSEEQAAAVIAQLPPHITAVCITYLTDPQEIAEFCDTLGTSCVQLHADMTPRALKQLGKLRPDLAVIKSLIVAPDANQQQILATMTAMAPHCDAFLTDSFDPATGATGATGQTHNWQISRALAQTSPIPLILAGGLNPANVCDAVMQVRPAGVDAHTGVEGPNGRKDPELIRAFVEQARIGFSRL